jgi:hypothetical protein
MPSSITNSLQLSLTVDGTSDGFITVASTSGVIVGARGYLISRSKGSITTDTGANTIDTETITIDDGTTELILEFDDNAALVTVAGAGQVVVGVTFTGAETADQMRDLLITAINSAGIKITASNGGAATVELTHEPGFHDELVTEATTNYTVTGMADGADTLVVEVELTATEIGLRSLGSDGESPGEYNRSDMSDFLVANDAQLFLNSQLVTA